MSRILLVEDEPAIADTLIYILESERYEVQHVLCGSDALKAQSEKLFDFAILDVGLPDMTGFELCHRLRANGSLPILFLTARDSELDRVLGLEIGGDDYVTKPFSPREVAARVRAILRRSNVNIPLETQATCTSNIWLSVDDFSKRIICDGHALELTAYEFKLAVVLIQHPGQVFSRDQLLDQAWDDPGAVTDRTVDAHIKSLRAKLRNFSPGSEEMILTRRGLGYVYVPLKS
jgi:two-component system, OmpR family, catabolic regulation response regulator CreB